jgi:hypothetical protein
MFVEKQRKTGAGLSSTHLSGSSPIKKIKIAQGPVITVVIARAKDLSGNLLIQILINKSTNNY